jgi:transposase-like protein
MDSTQHWCANNACANVRKVAAGNIQVYNYSERRYYCTTCRQTFSADTGIFFETLRSERQQVVDVLAMLMERNGLRALERLRHYSHNTILHWVDLAGQHAAAVSAQLINTTLSV